MKKEEQKLPEAGRLGAQVQRRPQRPAPGKVTRSSKLPPRAGGAVQRKESSSASAASGAATPDVKSAWEWTIDPWIDAAHRGTSPVQAKGQVQAKDPEDVHRAAAEGVSGSGSALPYQDRIQESFGRAYDLGAIRAHIGGAAAKASASIGAEAYATGESIAFRSQPDLHTAAHEAAHVVQQRAGVSLPGGVGQSGDAYERHADAVADAVVRGESATPLLSSMSMGGGKATGVQRQDPDEELDQVQEPTTPLTTAQRNALHTLLASRLGSAFTKYAIACEEVNDEIEAERAARVELIMTLVSVGFVFATPAMGRAITSLVSRIPASASVTTHRVALGIMGQADQIAGAMAEVGKSAAKPAVEAALASDEEDYLAALSQGFSLMVDSIVSHVAANIENATALPDERLWVYVSQWDPQNVTQGGYESTLRTNARAFRRQVQPIGTPVVQELGGPTNLGQTADGQWHLYEHYADWRHTRRTAVSSSMLEGALHRSFAEFGGPWRMEYVEDDIITGGDVVPIYRHGKHGELRSEYARYDQR